MAFDLELARRMRAQDPPAPYAEIAAAMRPPVHETTAMRRLKAAEESPDPAGASFTQDAGSFTTEAAPDLGDLDTLIQERGLDPADWVVERAKVNEWDSPAGETLKQLTVHLRRRVTAQLVLPARDVKPRKRKPRSLRGGIPVPRQVLVLADHHAPYHDEGMHAAMLELIRAVKPHEIDHLGDGPDFPSISRHQDNPAYAASPQECIDAFYQVLVDHRTAAPSARYRYVRGNHDERLRSELLQRAERLYGLKPAGEADAALTLGRLLHFDALDIEDTPTPVPDDDYEHGQIQLSPYLGARHGWLTGANSALKTLDRLGHSVLFGHTHKQALHHKTVYEISGRARPLVAVEVGMSARPTGGLGYVVNPDWQQGAALVNIWPDGRFHVDLIAYFNDALYLRNERYTGR